MEGCVWFLVLLVIAIVAWVVFTTIQRQKAREAYQASLDNLRRDPTNAQLRQETLFLGRAYAQTTRTGARVTVFDEVALMNDINAACAAAAQPRQSVEASSPPPVAASTSPEGRTLEQRLARLADLRTRGLIDEAEYAERRKQILDEI